MTNILLDYQNGLTWNEIRIKNNCSTRQIVKALKNVPKIRNKKFTEKEMTRICYWYSKGKSGLEIASKFNRTKKQIYEILELKKINRRTTSEACRICDINDNAFSQITPDSSYWIGFILADGNVFYCSENHKILQVSLAKRDVSHVRKLKKFLCSDRKIIKDGPNYCNRKFSINSVKICEDLLKYGITPNKSFTAKPSQLINMNRDFWRGVIDGDGSIYKIKGLYKISLCGSYDTCESFSSFVEKELGFKLKIYKHKNIFSVAAGTKKSLQIINLLYKNSTTFLTRKYKLAQKATYNFNI